MERNLQDGVDTVRAQGRAYIDNAGQHIDEAQRYVVERVRERPVAATLAGLGVGVLLGMLLSFENQIPIHLSPNARVLIYATFAPTFLLVFCAMLKAWLQQSR